MRSMPRPNANPLHSLGVVADRREDRRVDHAGAAHLDPAGLLADLAPGAVAEVARDVELGRGLREREEARAHAHLALAAEHGAREVLHRPAQVGERDAAVDGEALDLVEDGRVRRVERVAPVGAAERDDVDGRLLLEHRPDLRRRRVRAQDGVVGEVERVVLGARRMRLGRVQRVEVVLDACRPRGRRGRGSRARGRRPRCARRSWVIRCRLPRGIVVAGQRRVEAVRGGGLAPGALELAPALGESLLDALADGVQRHARLAVAHVAQRLLELALAPEVADARLVELLGAPRPPRSPPAHRVRAPRRPSRDCTDGPCGSGPAACLPPVPA